MNSTITVTESAVVDAPLERVWQVVSATNRYAEWVASVVEVTDHHGTATVGETYSERNSTVGPLTTRSIWTVKEIVPMRRRVDTATGYEPMHDVTNIFEFRPIHFADDQPATYMTYSVTYRPGLGPIGRLIERIQRPGLRNGMRESMAALSTLLIAETDAPDIRE
ncbi:hypothetical protein GOEFS_124_00240 [Gordonia effusa NBRC 100432]|uniref:Polyketide cyclase/dehydrase n=1 Tax=Gordonia effusa NBRC 100432 TaxID=1077974 RepID=H0R6J1_9ACTN|nr:SRPBCC family protein [Gordonia effusa]GAB20692.1 hypothetical protein GOEFS_124_00240 [Gordonia effusa NBRC 100432]